MTTAISTIQRTATKAAIGRTVQRLSEALTAFGERIANCSAPYYETGIAEKLEALPPDRRIEIVLRWHARQGRVV